MLPMLRWVLCLILKGPMSLLSKTKEVVWNLIKVLGVYWYLVLILWSCPQKFLLHDFALDSPRIPFHAFSFRKDNEMRNRL